MHPRARFAVIVASCIAAFLPRVAKAQSPGQLFGLAAPGWVKFDEDAGRRTREEAIDQQRRLTDARDKALRRAHELRGAAVRADRTGIDKLLQDVTSDSTNAAAAHQTLEQLVAENTKENANQDTALQAAHPETGWLPALDVGMRLAGTANFAERFASAGKLLYDVPFRGANNTHVVVSGALGGTASALQGAGTGPDTMAARAEAIRSADEGLMIGVSTLYMLFSRRGNATWVPSMTFGARDNHLKTSQGRDVEFAQFTTGAGLSLGLGGFDDKSPHPLGLTISGEYALFDPRDYKLLFGRARDHLWTGRGTAVLPLDGATKSVILEAVFTEHLPPAWQMSVGFTRKADRK